METLLVFSGIFSSLQHVKSHNKCDSSQSLETGRKDQGEVCFFLNDVFAHPFPMDKSNERIIQILNAFAVL